MSSSEWFGALVAFAGKFGAVDFLAILLHAPNLSAPGTRRDPTAGAPVVETMSILN